MDGSKEMGVGVGLRNVSSHCSISEMDDYDLSRLLDKPRLNIERQRSFDERSLSELSIGLARGGLDNFESTWSPGGRSGFDTPASSARNSFEPHPMVADAWEALRRSLVHFRGQPVGTIAAVDHASEEVLNYDQVFVRDFVPSALAFLMNGEPDIVKNFLLKTLYLQGWEKRIDRFKLGEGAMPASFKVLHDPIRKTDTLIADFGESAIGRVAPVDSGFWWIILLRAYTKSTGDLTLAETSDCQKGMKLILTLCLSEGFDTFPTLLCADGCSMIDRRMGVYGYPIEIQALFFMALRCALAMLKPDTEGKEFIERIVKRLHALSYHMRSYFWLDFQQLNDIYRYKTEEYSHTAVNKFNVIPDSIPEWVFDFMPTRGGYFIGNVSPARMDFRWFALGNCTDSLVCRVVGEFWNSPQLALEFCNWIGKKNFSYSLESCCAVIHLLVKLRRFDEAVAHMGNLMCVRGLAPFDVLEGLINSYEGDDSSPAVFDALVRTCTQFGATDGAYEVIKKLRMDSFWVTIHAWNNFLGHLLKLNEIDRFRKVYKEMISYGYSENVNTFNLIVYALCKECRLLEAISVFYRMLKDEIWPNVVTFNMIIDGACKMGNLELALKLVRKMGVMSGGCVRPNSVTYNCIINGFCKIGNIALAEEVRIEMTKVGIESNERTYGTLIDGHARGGSLEEAFKLCNEMVERGLIPNTVVYNTVIHWLYKVEDMEGASLLLSDMIDKHICPDQFTYSILTKGLCRNGYVTEALRLNNQVIGKNLLEDAFSHNILINYMCRSKNMAGAKQLLGSMFVHGLIPDLVTYGSLIDGYCKEGNVEHAVQIYDRMIKAEENPNLVIYNSVINGLCKEAAMDVAKLLTNVLQSMGLFDVITYNTLINGYCLSGKIEAAFALFSEMRKLGILENRVTYNTLINFLCKFGCFQQAKDLMKMMAHHGVVPDSISYTTLITHFSKNCTPEEVIELHDEMVLKGVIPDRPTYRAIVSPLLQEDNAET